VTFSFQRKLLYFPPNVYLTPSVVGVPEMTEIEIRFSDRAGWATAWYIPPANPDGKVVMVFHGNGSAVYSNHDIFRDLMAQGYGVWSVGYPGYPGRSPILAKPSERNLVAGAEVQYEHLMEVESIKPENIIFYGTSLGSGVAAQLAAKHQPSLLIMDAPFNSVLDMGRKQLPWLPVSLLMKDKFQLDKALKGLDVPLIWIHGTADRVIPISQGQKLYDGYNGPKSAHIIEGGQHTNLWFLGGREIVLDALAKN
jgi:pimeloyl-ACP methyl ester carboxylesterase